MSSIDNNCVCVQEYLNSLNKNVVKRFWTLFRWCEGLKFHNKTGIASLKEKFLTKKRQFMWWPFLVHTDTPDYNHASCQNIYSWQILSFELIVSNESTNEIICHMKSTNYTSSKQLTKRYLTTEWIFTDLLNHVNAVKKYVYDS